MRCTRCDGLAVPQAVGIAPDGTVVFGWCRPCLAKKNCQLVEIAAAGPWDLKLAFTAGEPDKSLYSGDSRSAPALDQSPWIVALVAFLMISWGLILVAAGLFGESWTSSATRLPGSGRSPLLGIGGGATALLGLGLMVMASRRSGFSNRFLLVLLSWLSFLGSLGILACAIFDYQPRRNIPVLLGAGLALAISVAARLLERLQRRKSQIMSVSSASWKPAAQGWAKAGGMKRLD
jgi:hypothetical protein